MKQFIKITFLFIAGILLIWAVALFVIFWRQPNILEHKKLVDKYDKQSVDQHMVPGEIFAEQVSNDGGWKAFATVDDDMKSSLTLKRGDSQWIFNGVYPIEFSQDSSHLLICGYYGDKKPESVAILNLTESPSIVKVVGDGHPFVYCPTDEAEIEWAPDSVSYLSVVVEQGKTQTYNYSVDLRTFEASIINDEIPMDYPDQPGKIITDLVSPDQSVRVQDMVADDESRMLVIEMSGKTYRVPNSILLGATPNWKNLVLLTHTTHQIMDVVIFSLGEMKITTNLTSNGLPGQGRRYIDGPQIHMENSGLVISDEYVEWNHPELGRQHFEISSE